MIVTTAGHVDHGKSTLVRLLTGTDPDRWDEEKRRGLTIDLGFAWMPGPDERPGSTIAFVDVPGHRRFVANMLAGCGAVDLGLLVVSAREGWMPQTEEHTQILDVLGVRRGLVALTQADLVDASTVRATTEEVTARLVGTSLAGCPIVPTSADDAASIAALRAELLGVAARTPAATEEDRRRPRLWIDRSFQIRGTGRVVTGTLVGGSISVGDEVVVRGQRGARSASVRGLHVNGVAADRAQPGARVGVALARLDADPVRGDALVLPGQWTGGRRWHVVLKTVRDLLEPLEAHGGYHVFVGTAHSPAQLRFGHGDPLPSSDPAAPLLGRLHLRTLVEPVAIGDRFVLRDEGRNRTVAGGTILAVDADVRRYSTAELTTRWGAVLGSETDHATRVRRLATALVEEAGGALEADALERELGPLDEILGSGTERDGPHVVHTDRAGRRRDELLAAVRGSSGTPEPSDLLGRVVADRLVDEGTIERHAGTLRPAGRGSDERREATRQIVEAIEVAEPPLLTREELRTAVGAAVTQRSAGIQAGELVEVGPFLTTPARFAGLVAAVEQAIGDGCTTVSAIRSRVGLSRKYVLPLLETLDRQGRTVRRGDERTWNAP